jgi:surface antigen
MKLQTVRAIAPIALLAFVVTGCQSMADNPKTTLGAGLGAAGGGLIAAAAGGGAAGIVGGVLLGGLLGGAVGNALDQRDKELAYKAAQTAFESNRTGQASEWRNPDSGNYGTVTPTRTYQDAGGHYCREYQQNITVGGEQHEAYGTACRQPDGSWKVVN